ncbi:MAG: NTP transferase domain-containing protein [Spirochaetes bacterium]|nr:NTP transferase domain-containing protein [Spirochaetota bacterium]
MQSDLPKVLHRFMGKPLILHVLDNLRDSGVADICVVVGYRGDLVVDTVGERARTVWQYEQLGTGHAVMQARSHFRDYEGRIIVACGDVPLVRPDTFRALVAASDSGRVGAVVLTMVPEDPAGYGRVVRDSAGLFLRIVEERDATEEEKGIREVNSGTYLFDARILFEGLGRIGTDNAQGEYYLPDVLGFAKSRGYEVATLLLDDPIEGSGVNTVGELRRLEEYCAKRKTG